MCSITVAEATAKTGPAWTGRRHVARPLGAPASLPAHISVGLPTMGAQSVTVDRSGVPFEETSRRWWTPKMPGSGLGRLYGTALPLLTVGVTGRSRKRPRTLNGALGTTGP